MHVGLDWEQREVGRGVVSAFFYLPSNVDQTLLCKRNMIKM